MSNQGHFTEMTLSQTENSKQDWLMFKNSTHNYFSFAVSTSKKCKKKEKKKKKGGLNRVTNVNTE